LKATNAKLRKKTKASPRKRQRKDDILADKANGRTGECEAVRTLNALHENARAMEPGEFINRFLKAGRKRRFAHSSFLQMPSAYSLNSQDDENYP